MRLRVIIARDGTVRSVQAVSGPPMLVDAAVEAVKTWLYKPTILNGIPVELITEVTITIPARVMAYSPATNGGGKLEVSV